MNSKKSKSNIRKNPEFHFYRKVESYSSPVAKKIILGVIFASLLAVAISLIYQTVLTEERVLKARIATLASDYYENYFYENMVNSDSFKQNGNIESAMEKYQIYGLPPIALKDLIVHEGQKTAPHADYILSHCDDTQTVVKFYPEPPFEKTSYRTEYTYACNF